jgi:hypothetical protein
MIREPVPRPRPALTKSSRCQSHRQFVNLRILTMPFTSQALDLTRPIVDDFVTNFHRAETMPGCSAGKVRKDFILAGSGLSHESLKPIKNLAVSISHSKSFATVQLPRAVAR